MPREEELLSPHRAWSGGQAAVSIGTYQVVIMHNTGERYALRFQEDGTVTGVYGPLREGEATVRALPTFDYSTERAEQLMKANFIGGAGYSYVPLDHD
jgi:hypothetical protein